MKEGGWRVQFRYWAALSVQIFPENGDLWKSNPIYPNVHLAPVTKSLDFLMLKKKIAKCSYHTGTLSGGQSV